MIISMNISSSANFFNQLTPNSILVFLFIQVVGWIITIWQVIPFLNT